MEGHSNTIISTWMVAVRDALEGYDVDVESLFSDAGISKELLEDPHGRISRLAVKKLWKSAVEATGDESFGLKVAEQVTPSTFFCLGPTGLTSENALQALKIAVNSSSLMASGLRFSVHHKDGFLFFEMGAKPGCPDFSPPSVEASLAAIVHLGRKYIGMKLRIHKVSFVHAAPKNPQVFEDWFGAPVEFNAERNALYTTFRDALLRFPTANSILLSYNLKIVSEQLAKLFDTSVQHRVKNELVARLENQKSTNLNTIARALGMSERTLQASLRKEETSFQAVWDWVRENRAVYLLKVDGHSVSQIASQLGFRKISSFTRAFQRWTGKNPTEYLK